MGGRVVRKNELSVDWRGEEGLGEALGREMVNLWGETREPLSALGFQATRDSAGVQRR
jgi:hypothetical protein